MNASEEDAIKTDQLDGGREGGYPTLMGCVEEGNPSLELDVTSRKSEPPIE